MRLLVLLFLIACGSAPPKKPTPTTKVTTTPAKTAPTAGSAAVPAKLEAAPAIVAVVDGFAITLIEVDRRLDPAAKRQIDTTTAQPAHDYMLARERMRTLNEMIDRRLVMKRAAAERVDTTDQEIDAAFKEIYTQNNMTEAELVAVLQGMGMSVPDYRRELREQIVMQRMLRMHGAELAAELRATAKIKILMADPVGPAPPAGSLDAQQLLMPDDIANVVGRPTVFEIGRLGDEASSADYDTKHFQARGKTESFDVAYRVWRIIDDGQLDEKFTEMTKSLPKTKPAKEPGDKALVSSGDGARARGFLDKKHHVVVLVVCGNDQCKTDNEVLALAKLVSSRLDTLK